MSKGEELRGKIKFRPSLRIQKTDMDAKGWKQIWRLIENIKVDFDKNNSRLKCTTTWIP